MRRFRTLVLGASVLALVLSACGTGGGGGQGTAGDKAQAVATKAAVGKAEEKAKAEAKKPEKPAVRIGSTNFSEQVILAELYGQVLEANGYRVERRLNLGNREIVYPAFESGQIDMYPEYLATLLAFINKATTKESDPKEAHKKLEETLKPKGLAVLDYSTAVDTNTYVVTKATADKYKLAKMTDLAKVAGELVLGAPPECPQRPFCLPGLKETYGITFKDFKPLDAGGPLTVAALEGNQVDVALLFSTDAVIAQKGFVVLEDDKKLQSADNVAPVVRQDLLDKAPTEFKALINGVSARLTTDNLTGLNKEVGIDRKEPKDVAAAFLKAQNLIK